MNRSYNSCKSKFKLSGSDTLVEDWNMVKLPLV